MRNIKDITKGLNLGMGFLTNRRPALLRAAVAGLGCLAIFSQAAHAATYTWQGSTGSTTTPTSGNWNAAANWSEGAVVSGVDTALVFNASAANGSSVYTATNNLTTQPFQLNSLVLNSVATPTSVRQTIAGGTLEFVADSSAVNPTINFNNLGSFGISSAMILTNNLTIGGTYTTTAHSLYLQGAISGSGSLTINETNLSAVVTADNSAYNGAIRVNAGTLYTQSVNALGTGALTLAGGKLNVSTVAQAYANLISVTSSSIIQADSSLTLNGGMTIGGATLTLRSVLGASATVSQGIGGTGNVVLYTDAAQKWYFNGNNTYSGTTTVNGGLMVLNGTTSGQGNYAVTGSATASGSISPTLAGNGVIGLAAGKTFTATGTSSGLTARGIVGPSDAAGNAGTIGTLSVQWAANNAANKATFGDSGTLAIDVAAAGISDKLIIGNSTIMGLMDLSSTSDILSLTSLTGAFDGSAYTIANYFGTLSGTFDRLYVDGVLQGSATQFTANGYTYNVVYGVTDVTGGYDIQLQATPEPATCIMMLAGFFLLFVLRRRYSLNGGQQF